MRVTTTIAAAVLGGIVFLGGCSQPVGPRPGYEAYLAARAKQDKAAVTIDQLGGSVRERDRGAAVTLFLDTPEQMQRGTAALRDVIDLRNADLVTRSGAPWPLEPLVGTKVRNLTLSGGTLDEDSLKNLAQLTSLESLSLIGTKLTDAQLAALAPLVNLRELNVSFNPVTAEGLRRIATLPQLTDIRALNTKVTPDGLTSLRKDFPKLTIETQAR